MIDKNIHKIPLYQLIQNELRQDIVSWREAGSMKLPSVNALCERFKTSPMTVKKALNTLMDEGVIKGIQSKGTFICEPQIKKAAFDFIGLVFSHSMRWSEVIQKLKDILAVKGFRTINYFYDWNNVDEQAYILETCRKECAGAVILPNMHGNDLAFYSQFELEGYPFVLFDSSFSRFQNKSVFLDHENFTSEIVNDFIKKGKKQLAFISDYPEETVKLRIKGFRQAIETKSISADYIFTRSSLYHPDLKIEQFLKNTTAPKAAVVMGDHAFLKTCATAKKLNITIPDDFSIVVFEDNPWAKMVIPEYSYVDIDNNKLAELIAGRLLPQISKIPIPDLNLIVKYKIKLVQNTILM